MSDGFIIKSMQSRVQDNRKNSVQHNCQRQCIQDKWRENLGEYHNMNVPQVKHDRIFTAFLIAFLKSN